MSPSKKHDPIVYLLIYSERVGTSESSGYLVIVHAVRQLPSPEKHPEDVLETKSDGMSGMPSAFVKQYILTGVIAWSIAYYCTILVQSESGIQ